MTECGGIVSNCAVPARDRLSMLASLLGVFQGLPGMLLSRQVFLFPLLFGHAVGVGGAVV
jgi:hypothetical protein